MKNESYKPTYFGNFIHYYDSLVKHFNSDTIYLYREKRKYYFILDELHSLPD